MEEKKWDIFISHAAEDKATVARPLAEALRRAGARVWLDEHKLTVGDSLSEKIDEGLSQSRFGAVIFSPAFFAKHWPKRELAGLRSREEEGQKVILPIWYNIDKSTVRQFSPILADVLAASMEEGIGSVAERLIGVIFAPTSDSPSRTSPSVARRFIEILESHPDKTTFLDFVQFHLPRIGRYPAWGSNLVFNNYEFEGMEFDAYDRYAGHGVRLTLVSFTEVWADPFEIDKEGRPRICSNLLTIVSRIKSTQSRFRNDEQLKVNLVRRLLEREFWGMPDISFLVFAGRRSKIDASTTTHDTWSRLLKEYSDNITIKTYDYLLDQFLYYGDDRS